MAQFKCVGCGTTVEQDERPSGCTHCSDGIEAEIIEVLVEDAPSDEATEEDPT